MNLKHLTDKSLHSDTIKLVTREREVTSQILHHLKENDRRKLYSDHHCPSLFAYCVNILGYSESSAQRRIVAARLLSDLPEIESKLEEGTLSLTNISQANQFFREHEIKSLDEKKEILGAIENLTKKQCEKKLFEISGNEKPARETEKRISKNKNKVTLILSDETMEEVEKLKALIGKNLSMDELIKFMAQSTIQKVKKEKFKQTEKPKSLPPENVKRAVPAAVKREVYQRDQKCLNCGSLNNLNFDHRIPFAMGGKSNMENVRLLCSSCNQRSRIKMGLHIKVKSKAIATTNKTVNVK
jgi:hypothetical protein